MEHLLCTGHWGSKSGQSRKGFTVGEGREGRNGKRKQVMQNNFKADSRAGYVICTHLASEVMCGGRILQPEAPKADEAQNKEDRKAVLVGELWIGLES